ncbi:MAG: type II toxin-antitoxin system VapC family toxin [Thermomicrobiales bacterium]|nr:type II toxin-antitoxin system VapC family toxin [Thermomicrobiales bacterium]
MAVVIDANLLISLAIDDTRVPLVTELIETWIASQTEMHASMLLAYEVASGLTRAVATGTFPLEQLAKGTRRFEAIPVTLHQLPEIDRAVEIAVRLRRQSAHDAAYVLVAQQLDAEVWTFGGPLARNAAGIGLPVRLIET